MKNLRRLGLSALLGSFLAVWFLAHAWKGVLAYFQGDDMMNMYLAWDVPWSRLMLSNLTPFTTVYRPTGSAFYRVMYALAGFHPRPFRVVCFGLLLLNIWVAYRFARRLTGSAEVGVLAAVIISFHNHLLELYQNGGAVYDILCFTFFWLAAERYIAWREDHASLSGFVICAILALNAKEMALALPAVLWAYELTRARREENVGRTPWSARDALFPPKPTWGSAADPGVRPTFAWLMERKVAVIITLVVGLSAVIKTSASSAFAGNAGYALGGWNEFLISTRSWMSQLIFRPEATLPTGVALAMLFAPILIAVVLRRRDLMFCAVLIPLLPLPVNLIPLRGFFVMYLPLLPWAIFVALLLTTVRPRIWRMELRLLFLCVAIETAIAWDQFPAVGQPEPGQTANRALRMGLSQFCPKIPPGGRILLRDDPFDKTFYDPLFVARLFNHDRTIDVDRTKVAPENPSTKYACVLEFSDVFRPPSQ